MPKVWHVADSSQRLHNTNARISSATNRLLVWIDGGIVLSGDEIRVSVWSPSSENALESLRGILALAKRYSGTLGFLPNRAFTDRARRQGLIFAQRLEHVVGYVLFDLPRTGQIKLVHVCVAEEVRGGNLAKRMTDVAIRGNPQATGIFAACREDYELDSFWQGLGLAPRRRVRGRALKGSILVHWWRPLGQLDLFESLLTANERSLAVLDSNVVADLFGSPHLYRPTRSESEALNASWLQEKVDFAVSSQVDVETQRNPDKAESDIRAIGSGHLVRLRSKRPDDSTVDDQILGLIGDENLRKDRSLRDDVKHLADAINSDARFFVTHDEAFLSVSQSWAETEFNIRVVRPSQLVSEFAAVPASSRFQSRAIESISYSWQSAAEIDLVKLAETLQSSVTGEKLKPLLRLMRELSSRTPAIEFEVLTSSKGEVVAAVALERADNALLVRLCRVKGGHAHSSTVALQLARWIRARAVEQSSTRVIVRKEGTDPGTFEALIVDGFSTEADSLEATPLKGTRPMRDFALSSTNASTEDLVSLERRHWPLVVSDWDLPTYLVPIHPRFAEALLC